MFFVSTFYNTKFMCTYNWLLFEYSEPIPLFGLYIGLFIYEFSIRGLSLERIYRQLWGPPVCICRRELWKSGVSGNA